MKPTIGKLTNKDSGVDLAFSMNPTDFTLNRSFTFEVEPCLGQPAPMVAFQSGGASQLQFKLIYDKDADPNADIKAVDSFLQSLNKIDPAKRSAPLIDFTLGQFVFRGYITQFSYQPSRFSSNGEIVSLALDLTLLSNGDFEQGKLK